MSFLPIVQRELIAAARRRSTFRARTWMVLLTSCLAAGLLLLQSVSRSAGASLFPVLATLGFGYCWLAGIRYASDALSEEKREGTLGLLFLTDLHGYDVVLGKLASISVRALQGLMAFLPVLSISLLLGGLTAGEFWRTALVLLNTLFFSLSLGLCVSALSRQSHSALAGTGVALALLTLAPLFAWRLSSKLGSLQFLVGISPATAAFDARDLLYQADPHRFWSALAIGHGIAWGSLILASILLPRSWQEYKVQKPQTHPATPLADSTPVKSRSESDAGLRRKLLDVNPVYWLAARNRCERAWSWVFVAVILCGGAAQFGIAWLTGGHTLGLPVVLAFGMGLLLKLWVAWHASATLAEMRRNGAVELVLATPLGVDAILRGQWQALRRVFVLPVIATLLLLLLPLTEPLLRPGASVGTPWFLPPFVSLFQMATFLADVGAIAMVGMWMGVNERGPVRAFSKTILYTMIVPTIFFCCPNLIFDLFWMAWAHFNLVSRFRRTAADPYTNSGLIPGLPPKLGYIPQ